MRTQNMFIIGASSLRGLAVPRDDLDAIGDFIKRDHLPDLFSRIRSLAPRFELSQMEYMRTILDFPAVSTDSAMTIPRPHISVLDAVNAVPFTLGLPPPRGVDLWWGDGWGAGLIKRSGDEVFADTDLVAIPKFPLHYQTSQTLVNYYSDYLTAHFGVWHETPEWVVLRRLTPAGHVGGRD